MQSANKTPDRKLFGTDGIRGIANVPPMTIETAMRLSRDKRAAPTKIRA